MAPVWLGLGLVLLLFPRRLNIQAQRFQPRHEIRIGGIFDNNQIDYFQVSGFSWREVFKSSPMGPFHVLYLYKTLEETEKGERKKPGQNFAKFGLFLL